MELNIGMKVKEQGNPSSLGNN